MTDSARDTFARMTEIPPGFFFAAVALVIVGSIAAALCRIPYDEDESHAFADPEAPDICGATDGVLTCTQPPHAGDLHLDGTRGTQYHSATFRAGRAA